MGKTVHPVAGTKPVPTDLPVVAQSIRGEFGDVEGNVVCDAPGQPDEFPQILVGVFTKGKGGGKGATRNRPSTGKNRQTEDDRKCYNCGQAGHLVA